MWCDRWYGMVLYGMAKLEDEAFDRGFYFCGIMGGGGAVEDSEATDPFLGDEKKCAATEGGRDDQALVSLTRTVGICYCMVCCLV